MTLKEKYNEKIKLHSTFINNEFMNQLSNNLNYESKINSDTSLLVKCDNTDLDNDVCSVIKSVTNFNILNPQYNILPLQNNNFIVLI